jgi:mannan endo-1,4-beta-mannosidase
MKGFGGKILIVLLVSSLSLPGNSFSAVNDLWLEAENAVLTGVSKSTSHSGYSGTGYVAGFDAEGDNIAFSFEATEGLYDMFIGFCTPNGQKGYDLMVNGSGSTGMLPASGSFTEVSAGKVMLVNGLNTIVIGNGWGWYYVDYIRLSATVTYPPVQPQQDLTDTLATEDAKKLFRLLKGLYGIKILSGQHGLSDLQYIKTITNHTPMVAGFDLIEYSPSRIEHGSNPEGSSESWIAWEQEKGGIINVLWHWNAPADLINTTGKEWWRGFYTEATTFNIADVLADTASSKYDLVIRDIDAIAVQLKKFRDNNSPVLWRPLHEASGGWFWWGAKGPGPFIELWKLLYNRLVNYHQLHNLIWVYTSGDPEWYPGDDFVDIASLDIYSSHGSSMSADWENAQAEYNGKKLVALSESGTLPVPEKVRLFNTWWSWFSLWTGSFIRGADTTELKELYDDDDILTLEKMGDWRTFSILPDDHSVPRHPDELTAFYNPVKNCIHIDYDFDNIEKFTIQLYDVHGRLIFIQPNLPTTPGPVKIEIQAGILSPGLYIAMVSNSKMLATGKLVIVK